MNEIEFEKLHDALRRFKNIHPRWGSILVFLIGRCDGFVETMTLDGEKTNEYLMEKTLELLNSLPEDATDFVITDLIAGEFDGWYMTALGHDDSWDLTKQSYQNWTKSNHISEALISSQPHIPFIQARSYLNCLLGQEYS